MNMVNEAYCRWVFIVALGCTAIANSASAGTPEPWIAKLVEPIQGSSSIEAHEPWLKVVQQDYEKLELGQSVVKTPMRIGEQHFERGLGTHSVSRIRVNSPEAIKRFTASIGVDVNDRSAAGGSVRFRVAPVGANNAAGKALFESGVIRRGEAPTPIKVDVDGARSIELQVDDGGDGPVCDHADWADAKIVTASGREIWLDDLTIGEASPLRRFPFSFKLGDQDSETILARCKVEAEQTAAGRPFRITWLDEKTGLKITQLATRYDDFPAVDWVLYFENTGKAATPILSDIQACDIETRRPMKGAAPYVLHASNGAPANPTDFEPMIMPIDPAHPAAISASDGDGRSSNKNFPFFKIEAGDGSLLTGIGWSGQWAASFAATDGKRLRMRAGMELTHFKLLPGEKVRSPRVLLLWWPGDAKADRLEAHAQFRQLIYKHYAAKRSGKTPEPIPFSNTCFTRGGGWLNECNEQNQISLINAYAPLGLEALITDAGWFEGGWPAGAGNWTPRKDAYPNGFAPVALAAKKQGMVYGLWFEPERVVAGTSLHKEHPDWVLDDGRQSGTYLANFGKPEVVDYFFNIVKGFMDLPGFRFYRQDFNHDPLPHWRHNDAPDRQGISEIRYIEGLYAYWDRIAQTWPDSIREECASGGRRIDLETVMRMHLHQESDYWFDSDTDQCQIWALSHYLPNNVFDTPVDRLDDYTFHSALATSLIIGWIADAPGFDTARGAKLLKRYRELRHLLVGAYYPLLPYTRSKTDWMAYQFHRPDLNEGMVLAFRREASDYSMVDVRLYGLDSAAKYELKYESRGEAPSAREAASGADLQKLLSIRIGERHKSELITYHKVPAK